MATTAISRFLVQHSAAIGATLIFGGFVPYFVYSKVKHFKPRPKLQEKYHVIPKTNKNPFPAFSSNSKKINLFLVVFVNGKKMDLSHRLKYPIVHYFHLVLNSHMKIEEIFSDTKVITK